MIYDFAEQLAMSKGRRQDTDEDTLRAIFPECVKVEKTDVDQDRAGVDYIVTLRRGAVLRVDAKTRSAGCSRFWRTGPEVIAETWSVKPHGKYAIPEHRAKVGWTLDESKNIDLILFTFDPVDHEFAYVRPFPLLREAHRRNYTTWKRYKRDVQESERDGFRWQSECHFIPLWVVDEAIKVISRSRTALNDPDFTPPERQDAPIAEQLALEMGIPL